MTTVFAEETGTDSRQTEERYSRYYVFRGYGEVSSFLGGGEVAKRGLFKRRSVG